MKEGGENVTGHNFREELYLFYLSDHGRMNRFDGVRGKISLTGCFKAALIWRKISLEADFITICCCKASGANRL